MTDREDARLEGERRANLYAKRARDVYRRRMAWIAEAVAEDTLGPDVTDLLFAAMEYESAARAHVEMGDGPQPADRSAGHDRCAEHPLGEDAEDEAMGYALALGEDGGNHYNIIAAAHMAGSYLGWHRGVAAGRDRLAAMEAERDKLREEVARLREVLNRAGVYIANDDVASASETIQDALGVPNEDGTTPPEDRNALSTETGGDHD